MITGVGYPITDSSRIHLAIDELHIALPKLYGAPAYARPAPPVDVAPRALDFDDLPIEALQTDEDRTLAQMLTARSYLPAAAHRTGQQAAYPATPKGDRPRLHPKPLSLKSLAGRILGNGGS
jgi:hypothetical protein